MTARGLWTCAARVAVAAGVAVACAPAEVPWGGGGVAPSGAADRAVADAAELWIAADAVAPEVRTRAAHQVLEQLERLAASPLSRPYAVDARLLERDARLFLARDRDAREVFAIAHGAPLPGPEDLGTMRACLAHVLGSTTTALGTCGSPDADVSLPQADAPDPTLDELLARLRSSPDAASPIRQATADVRVAAAWQLVLDERDARAHTSSTSPARQSVTQAVRTALAELGRYAPGDGTYTLACALALLTPRPGTGGSVRARLEHSADQGLIPPWIADADPATRAP